MIHYEDQNIFTLIEKTESDDQIVGRSGAFSADCRRKPIRPSDRQMSW